jgi:hypothetical protein
MVGTVGTPGIEVELAFEIPGTAEVAFVVAGIEDFYFLLFLP